MLNYLWAGLILLSFICAAATGNMDKLSTSALSGAADAITLILKIGGMIILWNGLMKVAESSGLVNIFSAALKPVIHFLFPDIKNNNKAKHLIAMNMSANLLGLGNAATPLGLRAMNELNKVKGNSIRSMSMLVVINCASIQLVPTTIAALRAGFGSKSPFDIVPAVWLTSFCALAFGVAAVKIFDSLSKEKK